MVTILITAFSILSIGSASAKDKKGNKTSEAEIKVNAEIKEMPVETQEVKGGAPDVKEAVQEAEPKVSAEGGSSYGGEEPELEEARKKRQGELKIAKEKLGKQEWVIYLTSLADRKSLGSDILKFSDGKVTAKELLTKGYFESNCTINKQEDGTIVWETMQVSGNGDRIFWRGELKDKLLQGIMSMQTKDGKSNDVSFSTVPPKVTEEKIEPKNEAQKKEEPRATKKKGKK